MKVLITGFEPFNNEKINPSQLAVEKFPNFVGNVEIIKLILPTVFYKSSKLLIETINKEQPNIIIHIGQAGGSKNIRIERVAINIDDARIADNENNKPIDEIIVSNGENAYFSSLPIKAILKNLKDNNINAEISNSAGTFVCNHIMYQSLHYTNNYQPSANSGFVHIPFIPEQIKDKLNTPAMDLDVIVKALTIIIKTSIDFYCKSDISYSAGKIY